MNSSKPMHNMRKRKLLTRFQLQDAYSPKNVIFSAADLSRIIRNLNPNKSHGHDNLSIRMLQLCGDSIIPPLTILFQSAIEAGHFPDSWKKANATPIHKKQSKNIVRNYRPISLLPILGKVFEKVIIQ